MSATVAWSWRWGTRRVKLPPEPWSPVSTCEVSTKPPWLSAIVPTPSAACCSVWCAVEIVSSTERATWRELAPAAADGVAGGAGKRSVLGARSNTAEEVADEEREPPVNDEIATTATAISTVAAASAGIQKLGSAKRPRDRFGFG